MPIQLTATQEAILKLMVQGYSRRRIAGLVGLPHHAVSFQIQGIYQQLGLPFHWEYDRYTITLLWALGMVKLPLGSSSGAYRDQLPV